MALSISQALAVSFAAVLNRMRGKPENQWSDHSLLNFLQKKGGMKRESLGPTIECTLDYRMNPGGAFMLTDMDPVATNKTEVITAASYSVAELSVPIVWSKKDEATNPTENQKVNLVKSLLENAINTHDDLIEQALFTTSTNGFLGFGTHITDAGTGSDGGIDSSTETFWRNKQATYVDDTDIEAAFTSVWNACAKGSGSDLVPSILVSDGATQAIYEGVLQPLQRYGPTDEGNSGFKVLKFKNADYVFSQYGTTDVYFINAKNFNVVGSKEYFRDLGETIEFPGQQAYIRKIYSALQSITNNRSRLGVAHV